jgi:hypothetical protein
MSRPYRQSWPLTAIFSLGPHASVTLSVRIACPVKVMLKDLFAGVVSLNATESSP